MSKEFKPYIPSDKKIPELTPSSLISGILFGIIFGASSLYLVLKISMTVTASIPIAVVSVTLFRAITKIFRLRPRTILENNLVQTTGSAGESIAFGVGVTMPAVMILGFDMELHTVMLVSVLGGLLGVLMMIPLRHVLIVKEHGNLKYPEGTACANVLIAGEQGGTNATTVFTGFFAGLIYKFCNTALHLWTEVPSKALSFYKGAVVQSEVSPELLGLGYIVGPRLACIMMAGGVLTHWILVPMITLFGEKLAVPLYPATKLIATMTPKEISKTYVLYIGAGALAAGGVISLVQSLPVIFSGMVGGLKSVAGARKGDKGTARTALDIPMHYVLFAIAAIGIVIWLSPGLHMNLLGSFLVIVCGFIFVTVSARLCGQVGSSTNPVSGMTVATLLLTSGIFLALGWVEPHDRLLALCIAAIVCIAASNAGNTSQDLKTGFLVGATPRSQQIGLLVGVLCSALVIGYTLKLLNDSHTYYSAKEVPAGTIYEKVADLPKESVNDPRVKGEFHVLRVPDTENREGVLAKLRPGKYLVTNSGVVKYFVDPGINGVLDNEDAPDVNGKPIKRDSFSAPKAMLMSLIIDGILSQKLPWGLILLGVAIAIMMEILGIPALPFAVGVYLSLSTTTSVFIGGMLRWLVDWRHRRRGESTEADSEDLGPGSLYSSGLVAGGAIMGIMTALINTIAFDGKLLKDILNFSNWSSLSEANWFAVMMFVLLIVSLLVIASKPTEKPAKAKAKAKR